MKKITEAATVGRHMLPPLADATAVGSWNSSDGGGGYADGGPARSGLAWPGPGSNLGWA